MKVFWVKKSKRFGKIKEQNVVGLNFYGERKFERLGFVQDKRASEIEIPRRARRVEVEISPFFATLSAATIVDVDDDHDDVDVTLRQLIDFKPARKFSFFVANRTV